jgi:hypothetical protein
MLKSVLNNYIRSKNGLDLQTIKLIYSSAPSNL